MAELQRALGRVAPDALPWFRDPADPADVEALPEPLAAWLARHDGSVNRLDRWELLSARAIADLRQFHPSLREEYARADDLVRPEPGVRKCWWTDGWVPFAGDGAGNELCVDVEPDTGGRVGQVIEFVHDHEVRPRVADDLPGWFRGVAGVIERGEWVVVEHEGWFDGLVNRATLRGTLVVSRIRGERPDERRARLERDLVGDPGTLGVVVSGYLRRRQAVEVVPGAFAPRVVWPALHRALEGDDPVGVRLARLVEALRTCPDVARVDVTADELAADLAAEF